MQWGNLSKIDFTDSIKKKAVIIPIGAIEAHGDHLPCDTDACIVDTLSKRLAEETESLVIPTLSHGPCETLLAFGGTITITEETCFKLVEEIVLSIISQGFHSIFILNGHGGNTVVLEKICKEYSNKIHIKAMSWYDLAFLRDLKRQDKTYQGDHADRLETEMMLAISKNHVKMNLAVDDMPEWPDNYENLDDYSTIMKYAVEGYPTAASERNGVLLLKKIIEVLRKEVQSN